MTRNHPTTTVYKVVDAELKSPMAHFLPPELIVQYKIGEPVKPKQGVLFAFNDITWAIPSCYPDKRIFRCEAELAELPVYIATNVDFGLCSGEVPDFWSRVKLQVNDSYWLSKALPKGTILCSSITLIREM